MTNRTLADYLRAEGARRPFIDRRPSMADQWFPAYGLSSAGLALDRLIQQMPKTRTPAPAAPKPRNPPAPPPPPPLPDPEAVREVGDTVIDAMDGAYQAEDEERAAGAATGIVTGKLRDGPIDAMARAAVPGNGPLSRMTEDVVAELIDRIVPDRLQGAPRQEPGPRSMPAAPRATGPEDWEREYYRVSDPYFSLEEAARREGRKVTRQERLAYELLPNDQRLVQQYGAMAIALRERADRAFASARQRGVDPANDPEFRFWDDRNTNALRLRDQANSEWLKRTQPAGQP